jgi:hypothetical protein
LFQEGTIDVPAGAAKSGGCVGKIAISFVRPLPAAFISVEIQGRGRDDGRIGEFPLILRFSSGLRSVTFVINYLHDSLQSQYAFRLHPSG